MNIFVTFEEGMWIAQYIEHDICVQSENLEDLLPRLMMTIDLESNQEGGLERIPPAPKNTGK